MYQTSAKSILFRKHSCCYLFQQKMGIQVDLHVGGCFTLDGKQHGCSGNVFVSLESHYQHVIELYYIRSCGFSGLSLNILLTFGGL